MPKSTLRTPQNSRECCLERSVGSLSGELPSLSGKAAALVEILPSLDGSEAKLLLLFLLHPDTTLATPVSTAKLAARAGLSASRTQAALQRFVQQGWFERELRGSAGTCYRWRLGGEGERAGLPLPECPGARNAGAPKDSGASADSRAPIASGAGSEPAVARDEPGKHPEAQQSADWVSRGRQALATVCPAVQEPDWERLVGIARGEERLAMCLVWFQEVAPRSFPKVRELEDRVRQECCGRVRGDPTRFQLWEEEQRRTLRSV